MSKFEQILTQVLNYCKQNKPNETELYNYIRTNVLDENTLRKDLLNHIEIEFKSLTLEQKYAKLLALYLQRKVDDDIAFIINSITMQEVFKQVEIPLAKYTKKERTE